MRKILTVCCIAMASLVANAQIDTNTGNDINRSTNKTSNLKENILLSEDFECGAMPAGWSEQIGNATQGWAFSDDGSSSSWNIPSHTIYAFVNDDACNCDMSEMYLITKSIDFSALSSVVVELDYLTAVFQNPNEAKVKASVAGGAWEDVGVLETSFDWLHAAFDLSAYAGENDVKLAFYYSDGGGWEFGLAIDNVVVREQYEYDLAATAILPSFVAVGASAKPQVTVSNIGTAAVTNFQVKVSDGLAYEETIEVTESLSSYTNMDIVFPMWTPAEGTQNLRATILYPEDDDQSNNILNVSCEVASLGYVNNKAYVSKMPRSANVGRYGMQNLNDTTLTYIGNIYNTPFPSAEEYNGTYIYRSYHDQSISIISPIDGSDIMNVPIKNIGNRYPEGLAWDWDNHIMYVVSSEQNQDNHFGKIDLYTYEYTEISTVPKGLIAIDMADDGLIYGPSIITSSLYKITPETGEVEEIGNIGHNTNYGQDVSYNKEDNKLYSVINEDGSQGHVDFIYGTYDLKTGIFSEIQKVGEQYMTFCIVQPKPDGFSEIENKDFSVYPNPSNGVMKIETQGGKYTLEVLDVAGKLILSKEIEDEAVLNLSQEPAGVYILQLSGNDRVSTTKIIKE